MAGDPPLRIFQILRAPVGGLFRHVRDLTEELGRRGTSLAGPYVHCAFYGSLNIEHNGSDQQKAELLPKLVRGELLFAYGLSEPDVGGDLASVTTSARRDGDSVVLNGAKIGKNCLVGAGSLVTEGKEFPDGSMILGSPARVVRQLSPEQIEGLRQSARHYMDNARRFKAGLRQLD